MAAILKIGYDVITPPSIVRYYEISQADVKWHADDSTHVMTSKSKPEIEFQYGGRPFSESGSSYISGVV